MLRPHRAAAAGTPRSRRWSSWAEWIVRFVVVRQDVWNVAQHCFDLDRLEKCCLPSSPPHFAAKMCARLVGYSCPEDATCDSGGSIKTCVGWTALRCWQVGTMFLGSGPQLVGVELELQTIQCLSGLDADSDQL